MKRLMLFFTLSCTDLGLTWWLLRSGGAYEANPLAGWLFARCGVWGLAVLKVVMVAVVVWVYCYLSTRRPHVARRLLAVGSVIVAGVVLYSGVLAGYLVASPSSFYRELQQAQSQQQQFLAKMEIKRKERALCRELVKDCQDGKVSVRQAVGHYLQWLRRESVDQLHFIKNYFPSDSDWASVELFFVDYLRMSVPNGTDGTATATEQEQGQPTSPKLYLTDSPSML